MLNVGNGYYQFSVLHSKLSKLSSVKGKHLPSRPFRGARVQAQLRWVLRSGSCQAVMEVPVGLCSYLELDWGRVQLQVHSGYYHNSLLCGSMAEDPSFFAGYWLEATQILEALYASLPCGSLQQSGTFRKPEEESLLRSAKMQSYVTLTHQRAVRPLLPDLRGEAEPRIFTQRPRMTEL